MAHHPGSQGSHLPAPYGSFCGHGVYEPAGALGTEFARLALGKADSDDEDDDSEAERQQAEPLLGLDIVWVLSDAELFLTFNSFSQC